MERKRRRTDTSIFSFFPFSSFVVSLNYYRHRFLLAARLQASLLARRMYLYLAFFDKQRHRLQAIFRSLDFERSGFFLLSIAMNKR